MYFTSTILPLDKLQKTYWLQNALAVVFINTSKIDILMELLIMQYSCFC